jgi:hypothetical protein
VPQDEVASERAVDGPCFEIKLVSGKGQGVFAWRDIPRGTRIISEKPLFSIPQTDGCSPSDIQAPFEKLSSQDKSSFFDLHDANVPNCSRVVSIFRTNCMDQGDGAGIFLVISRINHSCLPNAHFSFNENTNEQTIHAIKDIKGGEEILISYSKSFHTATERHEQLEQYAFQCTCEACEPKTSFWRNSDRRRRRMFQCDQDIAIWDQMSGSAALLTRKPHPMGAIEDLIELLEQEGLTHGDLSRTYADAAKWSQKLGRHVKAKSWAEKWRENDRVCVGLDSSVAEESKAFLAGL